MTTVADTLISVWTNWSREILLGVTLVVQLVLISLARLRWRGCHRHVPCCGGNVFQWRLFRWLKDVFAPRNVIWFCYVVTDYLAKYALGNLFGRSSLRERQLVPFWAPFFLLYLGGPDSITAFQLEDNQLSARSVLELILQVAGTIYVVVKISGSWPLIMAAWIMLAIGVVKYVERTMALSRANLDNLKKSLKQKPKLVLPVELEFDGPEKRTSLLMRAHSLFHICKHAMVDSSIEEVLEPEVTERTKDSFLMVDTGDDLLTLMEMELSLMYDFLYTKASVMYTWHGYCVRTLSPLLTIGAFLLVEFSGAGSRYKKSDVVITRVLLATTFLLEMLSLLRTVASSWTGFLLLKVLPPAQYHICHRVLWHWCRRVAGFLCLLANMDDFQADDPVNDHRRWFGYVGQLNLLQRITTSGVSKENFWEGRETQFKKKDVYRHVRHKMVDFRDHWKEVSKEEGDTVRVSAVLRTTWGRDALRRYHFLSDGKDPNSSPGNDRQVAVLQDSIRGDFSEVLDGSFGDELQVAILNWHIGTEIYLHVCSSGKDDKVVEAIRMLSNYMMYLLAVRPDMLPGLVTRLMLEVTREQLDHIWRNQNNQQQRQELARILFQDPGNNKDNKYLNEGIKLGKCLVVLDKIDLVLDVWVDMLFYASYRCSKEAHAKGLADGGELVTVVWLLAEHASLFVDRNHTKTSNPEPSGDGTPLSPITGILSSDDEGDDEFLSSTCCFRRFKLSCP